jgi:uncharacterized protein
MNRALAALVVAAALFGFGPAVAQDAAQPESAFQTIVEGDLEPETRELAMQLVKLSGTSRMFDEVLPMVADEAKTAFIRANPQMQLGIIDVVDRVALSLVSRRGELDEYLAKVWASGFTNEEMQELIDFYSSDTGRKFAQNHGRLLAVQTTAAQEWGKSVNEQLTALVKQELDAAIRAEQNALESDIAGPAEEEPAPAQ